MVISQNVAIGLRWVFIALIAAGCQFSSGAGGAEGGTDTEGADTEGADTEGADTGAVETTAATSPSTSTGSTSTSTTSSTSPSSSTDGESGTTGSGTVCERFATWIWAVDVPDEATTLTKTPAPILPLIDDEEVVFLRAVTGGQGTAALSFEMPCSDEAIFWALAWDAAGAVENADAYRVGLDQDTEQVAERGARWEYGCDNASRRWAWYRVRETSRECAPGGELQPTLDAGEHHLQLNNAEPVSGDPEFNFTGLAALVVTNDPQYDPRADYDPSPQD